MQPVQSRKFSKTPLLLFAFGLIVSLAGCAQPPPPKAVVVVAAPPEEPSSVWLELTTKMKFRRIPGGNFLMGSPSSEGGRSGNERQHTVSVGEFWLGETEVTLGQFRRFVRDSGHRPQSESMGCWWWTGSKWEESKSKNWRSPGFSQLDSQPVVCVSWNDAVAYAKWLSRKTGKRFRLPTEAEWEYAARAGTDLMYAGSDSVAAVAWYVDNSMFRLHSVATKLPNAWGLYDMSGNVWEWAWDWHAWEYYSISPGTDPEGASIGPYRVRRGGSRFDVFEHCRAAVRDSNSPDRQMPAVGLRLSRTVP